MSKPSVFILLCALGAAAAPSAATPPLDGGRQDTITVTMGPDQTLRGLAQTYLQDADAWPEILRANHLDAVHQLRPGMELRIPVAAIKELALALEGLRGLIYRATAAGAQVFATEAMAEAMAGQAAALQAQRRGTPQEAVKLARIGIEAARLALETSLIQRDTSVEAVLDSASGTVQRRRQSEFDWTSIAARTLLAEQERLRTLAASSAVVRFRDASSLRMSENAQLAIRRLHHDRLTRREQVDVVLYGGDVRALIAPNAGRHAVKIEVPGLETGVQSTHYWFQKSPNSARLANYDGEIQVKSGGNAVVVRENQGTLVKPDRPPQPPVDLIAPPPLLSPDQGGEVYATGVDLSWEDAPRARAYWLEVARDQDFTRLSFSGTAIPVHTYYLPMAEEGIYFWRVSSVDALGLPGPASPVRHFRVTWDKDPPYLLVRSPPEGLLSREAVVQVSGQTESRARIALNAEPVPVDADGRFSAALSLRSGANTLVLEAADPAGNVSRAERHVRFSPASAMPLDLAARVPRDGRGRLIVNQPWFQLEGSTLAGSRIKVEARQPPAFTATGGTDAAGRFSMTLPVGVGDTRFEVSAVGPQGESARQSIELGLDTSPPALDLDAEPPARTADPHWSLSGRVEEGAELRFGAAAVALGADGRFSLDVPLVAGPNALTLTARDPAGNERRWQRTLVLDREPPHLADYRLTESEAEADGKRAVIVEIGAADESGIVAAIPYRVRAGDSVYEGIARRCSDKPCYRDRLVLPAADRDRPRLSSIILRDYLGNRREITFE